MSTSNDDPSLSEILDTLEEAGDAEHVTINQILEGFGDRSLAPILLVPAMITATPISGIPGVPTITGLIVGLIVVQMLMGRNTLWVPQAIGKRGISKDKMTKSVRVLRKPVGWLDRMMKPRMAWLAKRPWNYAALLTCLAIAVTTPLMEFLPFVISIAAVAIGVFAAGILMRDGLVMLIGYALTAILVFASVQVA
ncbi:exopolysaccharide biosynthesis protein [Roseinatronobacter monicus]|uniref:exopolysaccharide biosynthesis protein n=1 Tax=Roseinatronobacter monicus TaxID=393481 RepID=UPI003F30E0AA